MEGVGARTGRSSSRYGPTTVFTGPVRKWKKKWIHVTPPSSNTSANHQNHQSVANGNANGSHLLLYKWAPIAPSQSNSNSNSNSNGNGNGNGKIDDDNGEESKSSKEDSIAAEEPRKRKFKYIPVAVLEEQMNEASKQDEYEAKAEDMETDQDGSEPTPKSDTIETIEEKPDINDVPTDENPDGDDNSPNNSPVQRQDLNVSTLDLSLGLKAHDGENDSETKTD